MALDKQVQIYSVDTGNFYSNKEAYLHRLNHKVRLERNALKKEINFYEQCLNEIGFSKKDIVNIQNGKFEKVNYIDGSSLELNDIAKYKLLYQTYIHKGIKARETKNRLLSLLKNKVQKNIKTNGKHHIRSLRFIDKFNRQVEPSDTNIISVFESSFTRMIGVKEDSFSDDFMVIQVYYFDVIKDLVYFGFEYNGERYIYFTSSAGQIRTKKTVFVKESTWNKYQKTIMCGLTIDSINSKGGSNPNKFLAYLALNSSATDLWEEFDIDKTIVIDDFETDVFGTYDLVDDVDYIIKRISGNVPITHTDGSGMMLPSAFGKKQRNMMVRLPWVKGLLGVFDFVEFIKYNNCSPVIKDIYGVEHDVIKEGIQVIFTKSQFKMWKYYNSWDEYKNMYKIYDCTAGVTNIEEDRIPDATINYQMLQSLTDITDEEIELIAHESINRINNICSSVDDVKNVFGVTPYNKYKTAFQKSISLYPELLNDVFVREKLRNIKNSMIKNYKSGKLRVKGKYTFLLPDFYAACEYWFGCIKNPKGLLNDGEVFCWLYRNNDELDCLRSPHLYREHAVRKNMACNDFKEKQKKLRMWFTTDAVYTSCHDLISKILMFDVDGDVSLVVSDKTIISVAKRNMESIVPLYYNMKKALPSILNSESIYNGLSSAFTGSNIGLYSNSITKIWNNDVFVSGTEEEKKEAMDIIKILCMENNFKIDFAKTLYIPQRQKDIQKKIIKFTKNSVPHFFKYAKDKDECQVDKINQSFVNKLEYLIPNTRISLKNTTNNNYKRIGKPDYKLLMHNSNVEVDVKVSDSGKFLEGTNPIICSYIKLAKEYYQKIQVAEENIDMSGDAVHKRKIRQNLIYKKIINNTKNELSQYGNSDIEITDILVKYLYGIKDSKYKDLFWSCYGEVAYDNLLNNLRNVRTDKTCKSENNELNNYTRYECKTSNVRLNGYLKGSCFVCGSEIYFKRGISRANKICKDCFDKKMSDSKRHIRRRIIPSNINNVRNNDFRVKENNTKSQDNIYFNETKEVQCIECGAWFETNKYSNSRVCRCENCQSKRKRKMDLANMKKYRKNNR